MCSLWRWSLQPSRPLDCLGFLQPNSRRGAGGTFHAYVNVNSSVSHQNLPPDPLASRGQKNRHQKNTLHNTLCNKPSKLIAGEEKRKNWEIMLRPFSIVLSSRHEGHTGGLRGFTNRNANDLSQPDTLIRTV